MKVDLAQILQIGMNNGRIVPQTTLPNDIIVGSMVSTQQITPLRITALVIRWAIICGVSLNSKMADYYILRRLILFLDKFGSKINERQRRCREHLVLDNTFISQIMEERNKTGFVFHYLLCVNVVCSQCQQRLCRADTRWYCDSFHSAGFQSERHFLSTCNWSAAHVSNVNSVLSRKKCSSLFMKYGLRKYKASLFSSLKHERMCL